MTKYYGVNNESSSAIFHRLGQRPLKFSLVDIFFDGRKLVLTTDGTNSNVRYSEAGNMEFTINGTHFDLPMVNTGISYPLSNHIEYEFEVIPYV